MRPVHILLKLIIEELGLENHKQTQYGIYLAQQMGLGTGYHFGWYDNRSKGHQNAE